MKKRLARLLRRQANRLDPPKSYIYGNHFTDCTVTGTNANAVTITYSPPPR